MQNLKNPGDMVAVVRYMEDYRNNFENRHMPKDLTEEQEKSSVQKNIQEKRIKVFVTREIKCNPILSSYIVLSWGNVHSL